MSCSTIHYLCVYYSREKKKRPNKPTLLIELFLIPAQNSPLRSQEEKKRETGKTVNRCLAAEGPARAGWSHDLHDTFAGRSWVTQCLVHYKYHCTEIWQARPLARDPSGPTRDRWTGSGRPIGQAWQAKAGRIRSDRAGTGGTISLLKLLTESSKPRLVRGCDLQTTNPMHLLSRSM